MYAPLHMESNEDRWRGVPRRIILYVRTRMYISIINIYTIFRYNGGGCVYFVHSGT